MKSIMEEATTIVKAIENAWVRAGKPQEFTIKILEHPETGFLGLKTVKSAKIALLFSEVASRHETSRQPRPTTRQAPDRSSDRPERSERSYDRQPRQGSGRQMPQRRERDQRPERQDRYERYDRPERTEHRQERSEPRSEYADRSERTDRSDNMNRDQNRLVWTPEMVEAAQEWLRETLVLMGHPDVTVKPYVANNYLKLTLDRSIGTDAQQEEILLKSWVGLALSALQEKFNQSLRGLRLVLDVRRS